MLRQAFAIMSRLEGSAPRKCATPAPPAFSSALLPVNVRLHFSEAFVVKFSGARGMRI